MTNHPTVHERHRARFAKKAAAAEHGALRFRITVAGGTAVHKSTLSFGKCREAVVVQAKAGREIWVREMTTAPVVILELNRKGFGHCYHPGSMLPLFGTLPNWVGHIKQAYIDNYPGGIQRD